MKENIVLMGDRKIYSIPIREDDSPLVSFLIKFPELIFDENAIDTKSYFGREKIGEMLIYAQNLLPRGIKFLIKECYRNPEMQKKLWDMRLEDLK